ncbi:MAG: hypothetical protein ACHQKZ_06965 [Solirubrobacterales bacterium]|jgi:hypothetical protein
MKRLATSLALILLVACGESQQSCEIPTGTFYDDTGTSEPAGTVVPTVSTGPGKITYVNSDPAPGATISGCGEAFGGCQERLRIVFSLRPDVDLVSQRLQVSFIAQTEAVLECFSTGFDLQAGETFQVEVSCPSSPGGASAPFRAATMRVETGPPSQRIGQDWKVSYAFLP